METLNRLIFIPQSLTFQMTGQLGFHLFVLWVNTLSILMIFIIFGQGC